MLSQNSKTMPGVVIRSPNPKKRKKLGALVAVGDF